MSGKALLGMNSISNILESQGFVALIDQDKVNEVRVFEWVNAMYSTNYIGSYSNVMACVSSSKPRTLILRYPVSSVCH